jgi:hypothetical protein
MLVQPIFRKKRKKIKNNLQTPPLIQAGVWTPAKEDSNREQHHYLQTRAGAGFFCSRCCSFQKFLENLLAERMVHSVFR